MSSDPGWKLFLSDLNFDHREEEAVIDVLRSRWLTMGPRTEAFEQRVAESVGASHAVALSSCTAGLYLLLRAADVGPGDEVLLPSLTFAATANVVLNAGATPVFCDIISSDLPLLDPDDVARKLTPRSRAVYAVDYAGVPCDYDRLRGVIEAFRPGARSGAEPPRIYLFEDAAHGIGGRLDPERQLGVCGDAGVYSFFSNKNLVTGEGGMVVTCDEGLAGRVRSLRSHGLTHSTWSRHQGGTPGYDVTEAGWNFRPSEITAALGLVQLEKLADGQQRRAEIVSKYREGLGDIPEVQIPFSGAKYWEASANHIFPMLLSDQVQRDRVREALLAQRIQVSHHYDPVHQFGYYRDRVPSAAVVLPVTEDFAARELTLPLHPGLSSQDVERVVDIIRETVSI